MLTKEEQSADAPGDERTPAHDLENLYGRFLGAVVPGDYSGRYLFRYFCTPTEAACVSVVYSIFASVFIYKEMGKKELFQTLAASVLNGVTSFLLGYSTVFFHLYDL